jgi:glucuronate isomerase
MEPASVAELQVLLEGVSLPAERASLLSYALHEGARGEQIALLKRLPERQYDNIDEVAEELVQVQPSYEHEVPHSPHEESGAPPGGDAYTQRG